MNWSQLDPFRAAPDTRPAYRIVRRKQPTLRRGAVLVDVCLFGFLTSFLVVGLVVVFAPESRLSRAVLRLAGIEETAPAAPLEVSKLPQQVPTEPREPLSTARDEPPPSAVVEQPPREVRQEPKRPPEPEVVRQPSEPEPPNEWGEIQRFADDADQRIDAVGRDYYLEMDQIGWNSILQPWHLNQDDRLLKSKSMIRQASSLVRQFESRSGRLMRELRADIYRLAISDRSKRRLEAIVERFVIDARWDELWELEKRKINRVGDIIDLLAANKRGVAWKIEGDRLLFAKSSNVQNKFYALMEELNRITEKKLQIHREVNTVRQKRMKEMKRWADG